MLAEIVRVFLLSPTRRASPLVAFVGEILIIDTSASPNADLVLGPSYTIPDSHPSDITFYYFEVNLAFKIMII